MTKPNKAICTIRSSSENFRRLVVPATSHNVVESLAARHRQLTGRDTAPDRDNVLGVGGERHERGGIFHGSRRARGYKMTMLMHDSFGVVRTSLKKECCAQSLSQKPRVDK